MRIAIIDMDSVMFSIGNGNKVLDESGEPIKEDGKFVYTPKTPHQLIDSADFMMKSILDGCKADGYVAYIKGKNTQFRKEFNADYKAKRPKESPSWWNFVKEYLKIAHGVVEVNGIEVDDAVNITRLFIPDSFIAAIDKDLLQLPGTHYNWRTGEWITTTEEKARYYLWYDMIVGQPGDNVKGVPGKGEKYAEKVLTDPNTYSSVVVSLYEEAFGNKWMEEFTKNLWSLQILTEHPEFTPASHITLNRVNDEIASLF